MISNAPQFALQRPPMQSGFGAGMMAPPPQAPGGPDLASMLPLLQLLKSGLGGQAQGAQPTRPARSLPTQPNQPPFAQPGPMGGGMLAALQALGGGM